MGISDTGQKIQCCGLRAAFWGCHCLLVLGLVLVLVLGHRTDRAFLQKGTPEASR